MICPTPGNATLTNHCISWCPRIRRKRLNRRDGLLTHFNISRSCAVYDQKPRTLDGRNRAHGSVWESRPNNGDECPLREEAGSVNAPLTFHLGFWLRSINYKCFGWWFLFAFVCVKYSRRIPLSARCHGTDGLGELCIVCYSLCIHNVFID